MILVLREGKMNWVTLLTWVNQLIGLPSLALSVYATWTARSANSAVQLYREKRQRFDLILNIREATEGIQKLLKSRGKKLPDERRQRVHSCLIEIESASTLNALQRKQVAKAIAKTRHPSDNDDYAKAQLRQIEEVLRQIEFTLRRNHDEDLS
ncbi:MAG: hypothetical protein KDA58_02915 [Planctomycetaceae bacterium]|nr:hypothetical protein [Planctomycetaceae bacterium]